MYYSIFKDLLILMVGLNGLEPSTSRLSGVRSNQLSYRPEYKLKILTCEKLMKVFQN